MPFTSRTRAQAKEMLREGGSSDRAIAQRFGVDPAAIRTLRAELVADGVKVARPIRGRPRKGAPSLDAAYLAAVAYVLEFERQGFPEAMSTEMSLSINFYLNERARAFPRNSEPPEEVELGARGARQGIIREGGKWRRIAHAPALWRSASWESCGAFVRHRLLGIEPPAILEEQRDGSLKIRKGWQKLQAADEKESAKVGGILRRTLRATLPLLKQHGHNPKAMRDLLAMRQSPRRGA